jgi:beta-galactosamide-alpha-2,3-sialyltransferase
LQSLIIRQIIEKEGLRKDDCKLFFYTYVQNSKYDYYYEKLSEYFSESIYFVNEYKFPSYAINSKKIFSQLEYENIYFAAVHSSLVLLALSAGKHEKIYTFDDGLANIYKGIYSHRFGLSLKKFLGLGIFGNTYTMQRIRNETQAHYTIYPNAKNYISDRLIPVTIFPAERLRKGTGGRCSVILGTVFSSAFENDEDKNVLLKISNFAKKLEGDVIYLPHPRSRVTEIVGCRSINSSKMSEEIVSTLYTEYSSLDFYGFCCSAQIHMAHLCEGKNFFFTSTGLKSSVNTMLDMASNAGVAPKEIIDLDQYAD